MILETNEYGAVVKHATQFSGSFQKAVCFRLVVREAVCQPQAYLRKRIPKWPAEDRAEPVNDLPVSPFDALLWLTLQLVW
jgi:hypothetical protein